MLTGLVVLLLPVIAAGTWMQVRAGIEFTRGELVGPIAGFLTLGLTGCWIIGVLVRAVGRLSPHRQADRVPVENRG